MPSRPRRRRGFDSYQDFAQCPNRQQVVQELFAARNHLQSQLRRASTKALVGAIAGPHPHDLIIRELERRGKRAYPTLIAAIRMPAFRKLYTKDQLEGLSYRSEGDSPLGEVLSLLVRCTDSRLPALVRPLVRSRNRSWKRHAGRILAANAADKDISLIERVLADDDDYVRGDAVTGIRDAANKRRASAKFRRAMFATISKVVEDHGLAFNKDAIAALLSLDRSRAIDLLCSDPILLFHPKQIQHYVLESLRTADVRVPDELLTRVLELAERNPTEYPAYRVIEQVLKTSVHQQSPQARLAVERNLRSASKEVQAAAMESLCELEGLHDPYGAGFERWNGFNLHELPTPVRNVLLCRYLIDQVNNGGFSQFFVNGYGRRWRGTLRAIKAIGATDAHRLLRRTVKTFGETGPPRARYDEVVASLHRKKKNLWGAEDSEFHQDRDSREARLYKYMLAHSELFKPVTKWL